MQGYLPIEVTTVLQVNLKSLSLLLHPSPVLIDVGSIDDEEEIIFAHLIDQEVVHRTAILIAHHTIIYLTNGSIGDIICKDVLHITLCIFALYRDLSHVRDVKETTLMSHGQVLQLNVLILNGHAEIGKRCHECPFCDMSLIETCSFLPILFFLFYCHCLKFLVFNLINVFG